MLGRLRAFSAWWDRMEDEHGWFEALEFAAILAMVPFACVFVSMMMGVM